MEAIPFMTLIIIIFLFYQIAKKKGITNEVKDISKEEYGLKDLIPIGIALNDVIGQDRLNKINKSTYEKIVRIHGVDAKENFRVYTGNKTVLALLFTAAIYFFQIANGKFSIAITVGGLVVGISIYFFADTMLDQKIEERTQNIRYEFPEFLSKLSLLINAGLNFNDAWEKVLESTDKKTVLYKEFSKTHKEIEANIPIEVSLKNLSRRCKVNEISKFSTIITQNIKKGTSNMTNMLEILGSECWRERKNLAKKKGEEASSKLLFPMMLMLIAVFIITVVPALMQMFAF